MMDTYIGEWPLPDWFILVVVFCYVPILLLGFYDVLFKGWMIRRYFIERRVIREIKTRTWKNNKRRASDSLKTFLASDVRRYD